MRARLLAMLRRRPRPPLALGILIAALCVVAETVIARLLTSVTNVHSLNVVYLFGVVVVASVWGLWFGIAMAVVSTIALDYFIIPPTLSIWPTAGEDVAVFMVFLAVALLACALAKLARLLAGEVYAREEADLSAELARLLLRSPDLGEALPVAAQRLTRTVALPSASIERGPVPPDEEHEAFLLGEPPVATLLVPVGLARSMTRRVRDRVVPALEVLLQAARERERVADILRARSEELRRVADEQAALRRLATLVAHGAPPADVFAAVAQEMGSLLAVDLTMVARYEPDDTATPAGSWNKPGTGILMPTAGANYPLDRGTASELVWRTKAPARVDHYGTGVFVTSLINRGIVSSIGCPIIVGRSLWGVAIASATVTAAAAFPPGTEERMRDFADLAATAIANAQSNAELKASRARIVATADQTRRRIERDLHDGAQQRLVTMGLSARAIETTVPPEMDRLKQELSRLARDIDDTVADLQEISRGLNPPILAKAGLPKALTVLAHRSAIPVDLKISLDRRLPQRLELTMYYVVSEALTNATKHARASEVRVDLSEVDALVRLSIRDDGVGGADPAHGSGLIGLTDRIEALGGKLHVTSPPGRGTSLVAEIPVDDIG